MPLPLLVFKILRLILEEIPSERVILELVDGYNHILMKKSVPEGRFEYEEIFSNIIKEALERGNPILVNDLKESHFFRIEQGIVTGCIGSSLCMPLVIDGVPCGAIYLDRKEDFNTYSLKDLEILIALSKPVNQALKKSIPLERIAKKNTHASKPILIGKSNSFFQILNWIDRVKDNDASVFIRGDSGTGKELVAQIIHQSGKRKKGKFIALNCGAIPETLLESELFGYAKGAFTGATRDKRGLIEEADKGTFFLDEIGDLNFYLQAKLLRVLQEKETRRIGENRSNHVDVRFISATNKNIEKEIEKENFREDLYYRLKIITIDIPPLRERKEDIPALLKHFTEKYCAEMKRDKIFFSPQVLELLMSYSWPGNVRELQNEIQRILILCGENSLVKEECLSKKINPHNLSCNTASNYDFFKAKAEFEKRFLNQALAHFQYNRSKTAEEIGLSRQGLFKLIKRHKIQVPRKCAK